MSQPGWEGAENFCDSNHEFKGATFMLKPDQEGAEKASMVEIMAWKKMADLFEATIDGGVNRPELAPLVAHIRFWGETLVSVRLNGDESERVAALVEANDAAIASLIPD